LHVRPSQVHEPVAQAHRLVDLGPVVDGERRWLGLGQDLELDLGQLDRSGGQLGVDRPFGTQAHGSLDAHHHSLRTSSDPSTTHWTMPL